MTVARLQNRLGILVSGRCQSFNELLILHFESQRKMIELKLEFSRR